MSIDEYTPTEAGLSWCAGFFEGEGCTHVSHTKNGDRLKVSLSQRDPEVLERFLRFICVSGKVGGPYSAGTKNQVDPKNRYVLRWSGAKARGILVRMWPYLGPVKRDQAIRCGFDPKLAEEYWHSVLG